MEHLMQGAAPQPYEHRQPEPIGVFPAIGACVVIMGAVYLGVYITFAKFWSGAM